MLKMLLATLVLVCALLFANPVPAMAQDPFLTARDVSTPGSPSFGGDGGDDGFLLWNTPWEITVEAIMFYGGWYDLGSIDFGPYPFYGEEWDALSCDWSGDDFTNVTEYGSYQFQMDDSYYSFDTFYADFTYTVFEGVVTPQACPPNLGFPFPTYGTATTSDVLTGWLPGTISWSYY